jgi:hypothetical protein
MQEKFSSIDQRHCYAYKKGSIEPEFLVWTNKSMMEKSNLLANRDHI